MAAKNATDQTALTWDALGRKTGESDYYYSLAFQYDAASRRTRSTWHDGFYVTYDYLVTGEMATIRENGVTSGIGVLATFTYDTLGRRVTKAYGNGTQQSYSYDGASRLSGLGLALASSAGNSLSFTFNPAGQIATRTASNNAYAWSGAYAVNRAYTTNGLNQYTQSGSVAPTYDARGNLTSAGSQNYQYTSQNRLWNAPGQTYLYADSLERNDYISAENVTLGHDGDNMVVESTYVGNAHGPITSRYVFGPGLDEPLVWYNGSGTTDRRWLAADERGSVVATSNDAGVLTAVNSYDESGIPGSSNVGRYQYTGQKWIAALGLYDFKARIYSPTLGRFLQTDPIGYGDGLNWHAYARNDPINGRDPGGMDGVIAPTSFFADEFPDDFAVADNPQADYSAAPDVVTVTGRSPDSPTSLADLPGQSPASGESPNNGLPADQEKEITVNGIKAKPASASSSQTPYAQQICRMGGYMCLESGPTGPDVRQTCSDFEKVCRTLSQSLPPANDPEHKFDGETICAYNVCIDFGRSGMPTQPYFRVRPR